MQYIAYYMFVAKFEEMRKAQDEIQQNEGKNFKPKS